MMKSSTWRNQVCTSTPHLITPSSPHRPAPQTPHTSQDPHSHKLYTHHTHTHTHHMCFEIKKPTSIRHSSNCVDHAWLTPLTKWAFMTQVRLLSPVFPVLPDYTRLSWRLYSRVVHLSLTWTTWYATDSKNPSRGNHYRISSRTDLGKLIAASAHL